MAIRERIKELVSEIQKAYVFGSVTGKYTCSKHKRFLELVEVKVYLSVGSPNQLVGERVCTVWKCSECGSAILEVAEEVNYPSLTEGACDGGNNVGIGRQVD